MMDVMETQRDVVILHLYSRQLAFERATHTHFIKKHIKGKKKKN